MNEKKFSLKKIDILFLSILVVSLIFMIVYYLYLLELDRSSFHLRYTLVYTILVLPLVYLIVSYYVTSGVFNGLVLRSNTKKTCAIVSVTLILLTGLIGILVVSDVIQLPAKLVAFFMIPAGIMMAFGNKGEVI